MMATDSWTNDVAGFGNLSNLPGDLWTQLQGGTTGTYGGYRIAPVMQNTNQSGQNDYTGQQQVGAYSVVPESYSTTPGGNVGRQYGLFNQDGNFSGIDTIRGFDSSDSFGHWLGMMGLAAGGLYGATALGAGGAAAGAGAAGPGDAAWGMGLDSATGGSGAELLGQTAGGLSGAGSGGYFGGSSGGMQGLAGSNAAFNSAAGGGAGLFGGGGGLGSMGSYGKLALAGASLLGGSGMSTGGAPSIQNPYDIANAQTSMNRDAANWNVGLNRVNQNTPWGSSSYTRVPGQNGQPDTWTQNINLSPAQQQLLDQQNNMALRMGGDLNTGMDRVEQAMGQPVSFAGAPDRVSHVDSGPLTNSASFGHIQENAPQSTGIQGQLDTRGVPNMIGGNALAGDLSNTSNALYQQASSYLDPQWANQQKDMETKLANQGIMQGSEAWNRAQDEMNRQRSFDYNQARMSAITGGGAEQSRLFGLGLASNQNAFGQAQGRGQFANAAQGQRFGQQATGMQLANAAQAQGFNQSLANAALNNSAQGQQFSQGMQNANLTNDQRQQYINEYMLQRQAPLNELNAFKQGSQVTAPQFPGVPGASTNPTDLTSLMQSYYNNQMGQYNSNVAQKNNLMSGLFGLGSAALSAPAGTFSGLFG